jgi:hypothetical protein
MKPVALMLVVLMLLSGCMGSQETVADEPETEWQPTVEMTNHSYQFTNLLPMGVGNSTDLAVNGSILVQVNWTTVFHEPQLWERGNITFEISVSENNNSSEVVWTYEPTASAGETNHSEIWVNGTLTVSVRATGSDDPTDNLPADWYVVRWKTTIYQPVNA